MSSSQLISMDFDHKTNHFEAYNDSSFAYMENDFLYPSNSPADLGVPIGCEHPGPLVSHTCADPTMILVPQTMSPMDISSLPEYFSPTFPAAPSPPADLGNVSPPMLSYNLSGGEMSSDALPSGRLSRGSGGHSPPNYATVPRSQRFNPIAVPTNRPATRAAHRRKASRSTTQDDSEDDDDEEFKPGGSIATTDASRDSRRETVRKQRIESEQRRRDELREGYARLKETLPASNQKASKVSILDRGELFGCCPQVLYLSSANSRQPHQVPRGCQGTIGGPT